jgi:hypothetical protein
VIGRIFGPEGVEVTGSGVGKLQVASCVIYILHKATCKRFGEEC